MNETDTLVQEQIEAVMMKTWCSVMTWDIQSLRMALEAAIFYLQCEPDENRHMINLLRDTLDKTFNPDIGDDNCMMDFAA